MANWLLDYIEMTEYIPSELREKLTSIRELDLQVHNAMDELERDIKQFFLKINTLSQDERQKQYEEFLKKCDVATRAASDKVIVADRLHELVERSMRVLDQGLEKLKEDLLEGDKAYIVEDLERKSQELDEQLRLEHENMLSRQQQQRVSHLDNRISHSKSSSLNNRLNNDNPNFNHHHRHSLPSSNHLQLQTTLTNQQHHHQRIRNNSTGGAANVGKQRKRDRKCLNSTMSIFNRNSKNDEEITNPSFPSPSLMPEYLASIQNSSFNSDRINNDIGSSNLTLKGMMTSVGNLGAGSNDKLNGLLNESIAKQPILTAIDAAHAVSPNATNSDKLVLFSSNSNGDKHNSTTIHKNDNNNKLINFTSPYNNNSHPLGANQLQQHLHSNSVTNQLSGHLLSTMGYNNHQLSLIDPSSAGNNKLSANSNNPAIGNHHRQNNHNLQHQKSNVSTNYSNLPLSSKHDPIMMAASQAINATQYMTSGRRTSSLKASYAAVNSGRLQTNQPPNHHQMFDQNGGLVHEIYCTCRSHIQGSSMIACDNSKCKIEWFHYECVGITTPPEGEWFCDECKLALGGEKINSSNNSKQPKLEEVDVT